MGKPDIIKYVNIKFKAYYYFWYNLAIPEYVPQNIETWTMHVLFFAILVCFLVAVVAAGHAALAERGQRTIYTRQFPPERQGLQQSLHSKKYKRVKYTKPSKKDSQPIHPK